MKHPFGEELHDRARSDEIDLLAALVLAASDRARHLTQDEVDRVLQLDLPAREAHSDAARSRPRAADRRH